MSLLPQISEWLLVQAQRFLVKLQTPTQSSPFRFTQTTLNSERLCHWSRTVSVVNGIVTLLVTLAVVLWPTASIIAAAVVSSLSHAQLLAIPWTVAHQDPLSKGFPRHEHWSGLPFPSPGDLPDPQIEAASPVWQVGSLPLSHLGSPLFWLLCFFFHLENLSPLHDLHF